MTYFSLGLRDRGGQVKGLDSLGSQLQLLKVWKEVVNWVVVEEGYMLLPYQKSINKSFIYLILLGSIMKPL